MGPIGPYGLPHDIEKGDARAGQQIYDRDPARGYRRSHPRGLRRQRSVVNAESVASGSLSASSADALPKALCESQALTSVGKRILGVSRWIPFG